MRHGLYVNAESPTTDQTNKKGLRCADILLKQGCNVTILEARDRLGGRVAQSSHAGHLIDL